MTLSGKVAIITGGGQGIGRAIALKLATMGADISIFDLNQEAGESVATEVRALGRKGLSLKVDVSHQPSVVAAVEETVSQLGRIDVLINNAGWSKNQLFIDEENDHWEKVLGINFKSVVYTCHAVARHMGANGWGKIVNIASDAARVGTPREAVYAGAKAGVIAFSKSLSVEFSRMGIRVNTVSPSTTNTPLVAAILSAEQMEKRKRSIPLGRIAEPSDIAEAVAFFASPASDYITGQVLSVNGGQTRLG